MRTDFKFSNDPDRGRELQVYRSPTKFMSNLTRFTKSSIRGRERHVYRSQPRTTTRRKARGRRSRFSSHDYDDHDDHDHNHYDNHDNHENYNDYDNEEEGKRKEEQVFSLVQHYLWLSELSDLFDEKDRRWLCWSWRVLKVIMLIITSQALHNRGRFSMDSGYSSPLCPNVPTLSPHHLDVCL